MTNAEREAAYARMLVLLSRSRFRSRFHLGLKDRQYICDKGWDTIRRHAEDFVLKRLAPAHIERRQADPDARPSGVPAQHATACCCRGCLSKWHHIAPGAALTAEQQDYVVGMLLYWLRHEMCVPPVPRAHRP